MALALGVTLLGLGFLVLAYVILGSDGLWIFVLLGLGESDNDRAIGLPLFAPLVLAGAFLTANALM